MPGIGGNWRKTAEIGFALFILVLSAAVWWASLDLPPAMLEPVGPAAFPQAVASIIGLLALVVLGRALSPGALAQGAMVDRPPSEAGRRRWGLALTTLLMSIAYLAAMEVELLGFREATVIYLVALGAALVEFDRRRMIPVTAIALIVGVGTHYVFTRLFYIDLP